jgi:hypothetical protein
MSHYQIWPGGRLDFFDVHAENEKEAREKARAILGVERLPNNTCVFLLSPGYYQRIVEENMRIGLNASNM